MKAISSYSYLNEGAGPTVVLLHGFCESPAIFDGLIPALTPHFRILRPTLPGHAGLPWDSSLDSIADCADWLAGFLDQIGVSSCFLVGHSLGGYIAAAMADRHSERLTGICMLHSTALDDPPERRQNRDKSLDFIKRFGPEPFLKAFVDSLFHDPGLGEEHRAMAPPKELAPGRPMDAWKSELRKITSGVAVEAIRALTVAMRDRPSRRDALRSRGIPVMYVIGEEDKLVSPARSAVEFKDWPEAQVVRLAGVGHMGMYEARDQLSQILISSIEKTV